MKIGNPFDQIMEPLNCPHCGRPFVSDRAMMGHVRECESERQKKLDDEWFKREREEAKPEKA